MHRVSRVAAIEPERAGIFADEAIDHVGIRGGTRCGRPLRRRCISTRSAAITGRTSQKLEAKLQLAARGAGITNFQMYMADVP